ncbi:MAG: glycoside hydrolase family 78 protein [Planctomycetaceae bacterium]|jgi:alpha-L-rhamnosidase|nr:glycoside hydrolase family 78 protein [Planctomycetaceae bacterium]
MKTFLLFLTVLLVTLSTTITAAVTVSELRCEHLTNPLGIDTPVPRLSWKIVDPDKTQGQHQTAYHILVATTPEKLAHADVWNSGVVKSEQSHLVPCGFKLQSGQDYYWKVQVWDKDGKPSAWSKTARFSAGLFERSDWKGEWIQHPNTTPDKQIWFRKKLTLDADVASAFIFAASMGYHELYVNGQKADERVLAPVLSRIDKRVLYVTYDVAPLLKKGENVVALWYDAGWTRHSGFVKNVNQAFLLQLNGTTKDGKTFSLQSDTSWKCAESYSRYYGGNFRYNEFGGEEIDGRNYRSDWNTVTFNDDSWKNAAKISPLKNETEPILSAQMMEPSRIIKTVSATEIVPIKTDNGDTIWRFDMGEQFTGYVDATFNGLAAGDVIDIKISNNSKDAAGVQGEKAGSLVICEFNQKQRYIARGENGEQFRNRFNYFGGRYIHLIGLKQPPKLTDVTGYVITSAGKRTGSFECSEPLWNKIYEIDRFTFEMCTPEGVTVDCPHRERLGYAVEGTFQTMWGLGLPCFDSAAFYVKNIRDWKDVQFPNGKFCVVAPQICDDYGSPLCGAAITTIAWEHYLVYGDKNVLEAAYEPGKRWLEFLNNYVVDGQLTPYSKNPGHFLGDWLLPGGRLEMGDNVLAIFYNNCIYAMTLEQWIKIAEELGRDQETSVYRERLAVIRKKTHEKYYNAQTGSYVNGDQLRTAAPLYAGVVPENLRAVMLNHLEKIMSKEDSYFDVGSFGRYPYFKTLFAYPQFQETVAKILAKTTYPGYGYFVNQGETVLPEAWEINLASRVNRTHIHTSYTGISGWFFKCLAGIEPLADNAGYRQFSIRPSVVKHLTHINATLETPYGLIESGWHLENNNVIFKIIVPVGTEAIVDLGDGEVKHLTSGFYQFERPQKEQKKK